MVLNARQFKAQIKERVDAAYDRRAEKLLAYMDRRGEPTKIGMMQQLENLERAVHES